MSRTFHILQTESMLYFDSIKFMNHEIISSFNFIRSKKFELSKYRKVRLSFVIYKFIGIKLIQGSVNLIIM